MSFLIVSNWKMNIPTNLDKWVDSVSGVDINLDQVIIAPPASHIYKVGKLTTSGQDVSVHKSGSFTGELSASILHSAGVKYCIVGHSERRKHFNEDIDLIIQKIESLLEQKIVPIVCIGESKDEIDRREEVLGKELSLLKPFSGRIVIAYEPIWAIGSSVSMDPIEAYAVKRFIQSMVKVPVLYGGSVNQKNAFRFKQAGLDGVLIGKASLDVEEFTKILMECLL